MKDHHHQEINSPYLAGLQNHFRSGLFAASKLNIHIVSIAMAGASLRERTDWKENAYGKFSGIAEEELSTTSGSLYKFAAASPTKGSKNDCGNCWETFSLLRQTCERVLFIASATK